MKKPPKSMTKDEMFLLKLYQAASAKGDPKSPINLLTIGKAIGQNDHCIKNIVRHLAQANFVKKGGEETVSLTPQGLRLVEMLLDQ